MKRILIVGSVLAVFLMTMLPLASAVNSNFVKEATAVRYSMNVPDIDFEEFNDRHSTNPSEPTPILITLLIWLLKFIRVGLVVFWGVVLIIIRRFSNNTAVC